MKARIASGHDFGDRKVVLFNTEVPNEEAAFAMQLVERFGLIAGELGNEDGAGRATVRLLTPVETVARAFDLSAECFRVMRERGMLIQIPDLNEINADNGAEIAAQLERKRTKVFA